MLPRIVFAIVIALGTALQCGPLPARAADPDFNAELIELYREAASAINAKRNDVALARLGALVQRVEALRTQIAAPERRRAMFAAWVGRYREYAGMLWLNGRIEEAFRVAELTRARTLLELSAERQGPHAAQPGVLSVVEARKLLPAGTAYLSYLVQDNMRMILLLTPERGLMTWLPAPIPNLARTAAALQYLLALTASERRSAKAPGVWRRKDDSFVIAAEAPEPGSTQIEDAREILDTLGEQLLGPVADALKGATRVLVAPDGSLAMLPFEALRIGDRYLIEQHEVQYTQSMAMYALSRSRATQYARIKDRLDLFALGGAIYEEYVRVTPLVSVHSDLLLPPVSPPAGASAEPPRASQSPKPRNVTWFNLPASEVEVDHVAKLFDPARSRVLKGAEASEERLWRLNAGGELGRYKYLLFATHGYANSQEPALNSVVLSQAGNRDGYDGYVTAAEWQRYNLRADLVVVSACNTGLSGIIQGEGLMGLPFALHQAGARNTLLSLWSLRDIPTADFVVQFFNHVKGGADHARALALTKRSFIANPNRTHPHHWAPLVLYGS